MAARVDVVIPCYNYGRFLPDAVGSVLTQEGVDVRVLIIDDASEDNTAELGAELVRRDERVEFRRHERNKSHIATYNEGIEWTSGEYWVLLSADDMLTPGALLRATAVMDRESQIGLVYGRALVLRENSEPPALATPNTVEWQRFSGAEFVKYMCERGRNPVPTPTAVVRTALQHEIGGYRPELPHSGDMEMWMRIAAHADIGVVKTCQAIYRWHGTNMQVKYLAGCLGDLAERLTAFEALFARCSEQLPKAEELRRTARRQIAEDAFWTASQAFDQGDMTAFNACIEFAVASFPEITASRSWRRLGYKRWLGPRVWAWLRPACDRLRGRGQRPTPVTRRPYELVGHWPDSEMLAG